jgi:biotin-dependent carboxylase-like uncharacterized protein
MSIEVIKPGLLSSVQDRGRYGYASYGVGHSGAMDAIALSLANALVDNECDAVALEITLIGPVLRFTRAARIAICGAEVAATLDQRPIELWKTIEVSAGSILDTSKIKHGARAYIAIAGGFAGQPVLGSRASDINAGLGCPLLAKGDILQSFASTRRDSQKPTNWRLDPSPWFDRERSQPISAIRGTHFEALDASSQQAFWESEFRIAIDSNRVGFRLEGTPLVMCSPLELISEPVAMGTVQLPPSGQPIALMAEHPTTGGYPRIAQIAACDFSRLAQRRPGDSVRFIELSMDDAQRRYLAQQRELTRLVRAIRERLQ